MVKPLKIIQVSNPGSGSTVLVNLLMAYFQPYEGVTFMGKNYYKEDILFNNIVIKTHDKKINEWINKHKENFDLYLDKLTLGSYAKVYNYDEIEDLRALNQQVVSLRWALMLKSYQNEVRQTQSQKYALLNEASKTMDTAHYYQVFSKTLALRNMKNFVRSSR